MGEPFQVMAGGCGGYVDHSVEPPSVCGNAPVVAGLRFSPRDRTVWLGFACAAHADLLLAPRPLLLRDRDVLARRRHATRTELDGRRWAGLREGPLARGVTAEQLVRRALDWAERHRPNP